MSKCVCEYPDGCGGTGALCCEGCGGDQCVCPCGGRSCLGDPRIGQGPIKWRLRRNPSWRALKRWAREHRRE